MATAGRTAAAALLLGLTVGTLVSGCRQAPPASSSPSASMSDPAPVASAATGTDSTGSTDSTGEQSGLSAFASVEEAYSAVAAVLACEPGVTAEPVSIMIDGHLPEYAMCTSTVQIVRYVNEADRTKASQLLDTAENGALYRAEGSNWQVLVLPGRGGNPPAAAEIEHLAAELGGRYAGKAA